MAKLTREIVKIDEALCDGCGDCVPSCAEGAIQIIDGKARLVAENLCDGFGNCLGVCPKGAITIEKREADDYDEAAVEHHLEKPVVMKQAMPVPAMPAPPIAHHAGCPGSAMRSFAASVPAGVKTGGEAVSALTQWPVQLMLVPPTAPFLKGRELLLAADCCAFASAEFHSRFLAGKALLVGCPKLDDLNHYREKLEQVVRQSGCTGITVMIMEVPCCGGLQWAITEAVKAAGSQVPLKEVVIGVRGDVLRETVIS
jgi:NAD-dependent dihydropyrimidine dehydrogenase PreA subunit